MGQLSSPQMTPVQLTEKRMEKGQKGTLQTSQKPVIQKTIYSLLQQQILNLI